jgi:hypothetical protein
MFSENPFYHQIIRKAIVSFGDIFSDIHIINKDSNGVAVKDVRCPISFARKQQWYSRLNEDPDFTQNFEISLPRLSFEISAYQFNAEKKLGTQVQDILLKCKQNGRVFSPVPYRLIFDLYSYTNNQEDSLQILEQILPFFGPSIKANIEIIEGLNIDIPISLVNVNAEDNYTELGSNRMVIQQFTFEVDVQLFGPLTNDLVLIKKSIVDLNKTKGTAPKDSTFTATVNPWEADKTDIYTIDELWAGQI